MHRRVSLVCAGVVAAVAPAACICAPTGSGHVPPQQTWELSLPGVFPQSIAVDDGGLLYLAAKNGGIDVLDPTAATPPAVIVTVDAQALGGDAMDVVWQGGLLFVATGDLFDAGGKPAGLAVVDVTNATHPSVVFTWQSDPGHGAAAIRVQDHFAYLGAMTLGVFVFEFADPSSITQVGAILPDPDFPHANPSSTSTPNARGMAVVGDRLWLTNDAGGLRVIDISDPTAPVELSHYINSAMGAKQQAYNNIAVDGGIAYVAVDYCGLEILDVSDELNITQLGWFNPWGCDTAANNWFNSNGHTNQLTLRRDKQDVVLSAGDSELVVVDVADPTAPTLKLQVGGDNDGLGTWGVTVDGDLALLTYITAIVPFSGTWAGVKALQLP